VYKSRRFHLFIACTKVEDFIALSVMKYTYVYLSIIHFID